MRLKVILLFFSLVVIHITATPLLIHGIEATISSNNRTDYIHIALIFTEEVASPVIITSNYHNLTLNLLEDTNIWFVNQLINGSWPFIIQINTVELDRKSFQNGVDFGMSLHLLTWRDLQMI